MVTSPQQEATPIQPAPAPQLPVQQAVSSISPMVTSPQQEEAPVQPTPAPQLPAQQAVPSAVSILARARGTSSTANAFARAQANSNAIAERIAQSLMRDREARASRQPAPPTTPQQAAPPTPPPANILAGHVNTSTPAIALAPPNDPAPATRSPSPGYFPPPGHAVVPATPALSDAMDMDREHPPQDVHEPAQLPDDDPFALPPLPQPIIIVGAAPVQGNQPAAALPVPGLAVANGNQVVPAAAVIPPEAAAQMPGAQQPDAAEDGGARPVPPTRAGEFGGVANQNSGYTTLPCGLVITSTPLEGFPIPRIEAPRTRGIDPAQIFAWHGTPGFKVLVYTPRPGYTPDTQLTIDGINNTLGQLFPTDDFRVLNPRPASSSATFRDGPHYFLVVFENEAPARALLRQRVISTTAVTIFIISLGDRLYDYVLAIWKFAKPRFGNGEEIVAEAIRRGMDMASHIYQYIMEHAQGANEATYTTFKNSIRVEPIWVIQSRGEPKRLCWKIYATPPQLTHSKWQHLREALSNLIYEDDYLGRGEVRLGKQAFYCAYCTSGDHATGLCPFPKLHGWLGPIGDSTTDTAPGLPTPTISQTASHGTFRGRGRGWGRGRGRGRGCGF